MKTTISTKNKRTNTIYRLSYLLLSLMLVLGVGLMSCEGPQGPQGEQGQQGEQGTDGPVGPAGEDGSVMFAGEGAPGDDIGQNGDYYLNQNTGELYGPKDGDGWGTPISLQGPPGEDGADGQDGSQILSGSGAPNGSLGTTGDFYLDKSSFDLYGPKTNSGWGMPINLQGNANVVADIVALSDADWEEGQYVFAYTPSSVLTRPARVVTLNIPEITEEIYNLGMVQVYFDSSPNLWAPLPFQMLTFGSEYHINLNYTYEEGELTLYYYYSTNDDGTVPPDVTAVEVPDYTFKYVITSANAKQSMSKDNIALEDHSEVMDYLNANFDVKRGKVFLE